MAQASIRVKATDGVWHHIGTEEARGRWAEGLTMETDSHGPLSCGFTLHRKPGLPWPELSAFAPLDVEIDGVTVWCGRVMETPFAIGDEEAISVTGVGAQGDLDFDNAWRTYMIGNVQAGQDQRSMPVYNITNFRQYGQVQAGAGYVSLGWAWPGSGQATSLVAGDCVGVVFDMGPGQFPSSDVRAVALLVSSSNNDANSIWYLRSSASSDFTNATSYTDLVAGAVLPAPSGGNPIVPRGIYTNATAGHRYLHVVLYSNAAHTPAAEVWFRIHGIQIASNAAYIGTPTVGPPPVLNSTLYASTIVTDMLGLCGALNSDRSWIQQTSLGIPEYAMDGPMTPREVMEAMNAYHDFEYGVWPWQNGMQPYFSAWPGVAAYEVGEWGGWEFQDASSGSGQDIYNAVRVSGTGPDGQPLLVTSTGANPALSRVGLWRTKILPVQSKLTSAIAASIGSTWLSANQRTPFKGSVRVVGTGGLRNIVGGQHWHASQGLLMPGGLLRLPLVDPDSGAFGRDVRIAGASYNHDDESVSLSLDNDTTRFDTLLARMALSSADVGS